ncbi:hypothetical protein SEA_CHRIS_54 [Mycobacterium phage Chris]|uniref:Uncharacterized protein n=1 Tax=Mycobacterium phage Chris TaxID=2725626 RepID=A0A6M3SWV1_9CAUD|nr:hypothetical protein I5G96_gp051 [Mycobacterium phage Chris]QJD50456.1 hypothetical protein SEA_CHRIS_54 [Mycobacterium phage Chris]
MSDAYETPPLCEVCGLHPATVFDPTFAMWCEACDRMGLGELAVREKLADYAEALGQQLDRTMLLDEDAPPCPVPWEPFIPDYAAINAHWREQAAAAKAPPKLSLPFCDDLAKGDPLWIYQDANGAHWGWSRQADTWLAWNTAPYRIGVGAVGPFAQILPNTIEVAYSNAQGKPGPALTSDDTEAGEVDQQTPDMVNQPSHYNNGPPCKGCGRPIECLDITEGMGFCLGNTVKYVWRCDLKHDAIEDLRKAAVYLAREITRREQQLAAGATN